MGRPKLKIKKNEAMIIRMEPSLKKEYLKFCQKNSFVASERVRKFIMEDLKYEKEK